MTDETPSDDAPIPAPIPAPTECVRPEWVDYNGHMNVSYYVLAFDNALEHVLSAIGLGQPYRERTNHSSMTLELHVNYLREILEGQPFAVDTQILGADAKRLHVFHVMRHAETGERLATSESMLIHVSLSERRSAPFPSELREHLQAIAAEHAALGRPPEAGRSVALPNR